MKNRSIKQKSKKKKWLSALSLINAISAYALIALFVVSLTYYVYISDLMFPWSILCYGLIVSYTLWVIERIIVYDLTTLRRLFKEIFLERDK